MTSSFEIAAGAESLCVVSANRRDPLNKKNGAIVTKSWAIAYRCTLRLYTAYIHVNIGNKGERARVREILRASAPCADYRYRVIYCSVFAKRDAVVPVSRKVLPVLSHGARLNFCSIGNVDRLLRRWWRRHHSSRTNRTYVCVQVRRPIVKDNNTITL